MADPISDTSTSPPLRVALALQGGGSHGAFTWGVLDALLKEPRLQIDAISGASAGAVNAVALAHGLAVAVRDGLDEAAGRELARDTLGRVWRGVAGLGSMNTMVSGVARLLLGGWPEAFGAWLGERQVSPYQANPLDLNPLRRLLEQEIDFEAIAAAGDRVPPTFVAATHVATGRAAIFHGTSLTLSAVVASACLPMVFQAVEIDGEHYWDGGFSANPPIAPLLDAAGTRDVLLVQINPLRRAAHPQSTHDILDRVNEMTFNASLLGQMRSIDFVQRMVAEGRLNAADGYQLLRLHRIDGGAALEAMPASSRLSADGAMIERLYEMGRSAAAAWLAGDAAAVGVRSSIDLAADYVQPVRA